MTKQDYFELLDGGTGLKEVREFIGPTSLEHMALSKATPDRFCYPYLGQYRQPFGEDCKRYGRKEDGCCVVDEEFLGNVFVVANNIDKYDLEDVLPVYADIVKWCLSRKGFMRSFGYINKITIFVGDKYAYDLLKLIANTPTDVTVKEVRDDCHDEDENHCTYITRYAGGAWYIGSRESDTVFRNMLEKCGTIHMVEEGATTLLSPNPSNYPFLFREYTIVDHDYKFRQKNNFSYQNHDSSPGACISEIPLVIKDDRFTCERISFDVRCYIGSTESFDNVVKDILLAMKASKVRRIQVLLNLDRSQVGLPGYTQIRVATHSHMKPMFGPGFRLFMDASGLRESESLSQDRDGYDNYSGKFHVEEKTPLPVRSGERRSNILKSYSIQYRSYGRRLVLKKITESVWI